MSALQQSHDGNAVFDCQTCGACCAKYRVGFYWAETDAHPLGHVPQQLTHSISPYRVAMNGTSSPTPRCVALEGIIGQQVACGIYAVRSSACREFAAGTPECIKARVAHGLHSNVNINE